MGPALPVGSQAVVAGAALELINTASSAETDRRAPEHEMGAAC